MKKPLISIVIPCFNEEKNIPNTYAVLQEEFSRHSDRYRFEIVFSDNHSTDNTFAEIQRLAEIDSNVRAVRLTRNFGFNKSLLTAYRLAQGEAAIQLDCDLQDPPAMFGAFLAKWEEGFDVVVGVRETRAESALLQGTRKFFYRLIATLSQDNLVVDGGDFRLIDKSILDKMRALHDATPYVRGLVSTLACRQMGIPYSRNERQFDESKFPFFKLVGLAVDGIVNHSVVPLRIASMVGFIVAILTVLLAIIYSLGRAFYGLDWPAGFTTQVILLLFGISLNAIFLGIIGEYISRIYQQMRQLPLTVVERAVNLESQSSND